MPKVKYKDVNFSAPRLDIVNQANTIIAEYQAQGFQLTLRQLYYQFVARDLMENKKQSYDRLGDIISDARLAGLVDWLAIVDRTRNLRDLAHWDDPSSIVSACARQFRIDKWGDQPKRVEVWIEKDALVGVIEDVCERNDVPFFSCRGYTSQSEMWVAAQRLLKWEKGKQDAVILHLGDHDPSGIDMSRDIQDRLELFTGGRVEFKRLALNMDQVQQYSPPPNFAKTTDARYAGYQALYGEESWELDALDPQMMADLIERNIHEMRDDEAWAASTEMEDNHKAALSNVSDRWDDVVRWVEDEQQ